MTSDHNGREFPLSTSEFVAMTACLMALNALAIDIMLPAMSEIGTALGTKNPNDAQSIILVYMLGFGFSQLVWGPITDAFGRKPVLNWVLIGYVLAGGLCALAPDFGSFLIGRFLLGIAAGGTRVIAVSVVRDLYVGRQMAKIMSLVMTVFMVVPIIAPQIGQIILLIFPWQGIFLILALGGIGMSLWSMRLPETRPLEHRTPINPKDVGEAYLTVFQTPVALGYMLASGVIFGSLFAYISASEQIFNDVFRRPDLFTLCFAIIAGALSLANFLNSRLVENLGQRVISQLAVTGFTVLAAILYLVTLAFGPSLLVFMVLFSLVFMNFGFLGPNFNSMAMEPLGKIAGTASGLLGFCSTTMAATIGWMVAQQYNGTIMPVLLGYVIIGVITIAIIVVTERGKLFQSR